MMDEIYEIAAKLKEEDHADDLKVFLELIQAYHPKGMRLIEDLEFARREMNPTEEVIYVRLPQAVVEWMGYLNNKYNDTNLTLAIMKKFGNKLFFSAQGE